LKLHSDALFLESATWTRTSFLTLESKLPGYAVTVFACLFAVAMAKVSLDINLLAPFAILAGLIGCAVIIARPFIGVFLLVFLAQLLGLVDEVFGSLGPYVYEGLLALTLLAVVIHAPMRPLNVRWGGNPLTFRLVVLFMLAGTLSVMFSEFRQDAMLGYAKILSLVLVFFVIFVMTDSKKRLTALVIALFVSTAISGFVSILGYVNGDAVVGVATGRRLAGASSTDPTTTANVMLMSTLLGAYLLFRMERLKYLSLAAMVLGTCGIVLSYSRSALMFLVAGYGLVAYLLRRSRYMAAGSMLALIVAVSLIPAIPAGVWERFADFANPSQDFTLGRRMGYHVIGLDLLVKNPVLGIGPEGFSNHYLGFEYRFEEGRRMTSRDLHNLYLGVSVEYGMLGFCIFASLLVAILLGLNRARKYTEDPEIAAMAQGLLTGFSIFLVAAVTLPALDNKVFWIVVGLSTVIMKLTDQSQPRSVAPDAS